MESVTGKTTVSHSVGTAKDVEDSVPGSKSHPEVEQEARTPQQFPGAYSKVYVKLGLTKALGEFEFARVDVGIEEFSAPTPAARQAAFIAITDEVKVHIKRVMTKIMAAQRPAKIPDGSSPPPEDHLPEEINPSEYSVGGLTEGLDG